MIADQDHPSFSGTLPWTKRCFVCGEENPHGLRLRSRVENGVVYLDYTTREADLGWKSIVHGGITSTLLDEVMTWAAILAARRACVSAEFSVRIKKPIRIHQAVRVEGRVVDQKSRMILTEAVLRDTDGNPLAGASGKYLPMPASELTICKEDFVSTPHSIPPERFFGQGVNQKDQAP